MSTREPLVIRGAVVVAVTAVMHLAVVLGWLPFTPEQEAAAEFVVGALGTAMVVVWTRGAVTPVSDPRTDDGTPLVPSATPTNPA